MEPDNRIANPKIGDSINTYRIPILLGVASILCIFFSILLLVKSSQTVDPIRFSTTASQATVGGELYQTVTIDIQGAVVRPGVYTLPAGSRVEEAIRQSGGMTPQADQAFVAKTLNRAARLTDGAKIYIPYAGEIPTSYNNKSVGDDTITSYNIYETGDTVISSQRLISINTGSQSELESLSGIGPVTAANIIANRPYNTISDLVTKKAVGEKLFEKLKSQLTL